MVPFKQEKYLKGSIIIYGMGAAVNGGMCEPNSTTHEGGGEGEPNRAAREGGETTRSTR